MIRGGAASRLPAAGREGLRLSLRLLRTLAVGARRQTGAKAHPAELPARGRLGAFRSLGTPRLVVGCLAAALLHSPSPAQAGFTETLPKGLFLVDESYVYSWIDSCFNDEGDLVALVKPIERYEPGGPKQGSIIPVPEAKFNVLVTQIQYGLVDSLSLAIGIPVLLSTTVDPHLGWEPGDYQWTLGRAYTEEDFWEWAASMGQPKPGVWKGNEGALGEIVLGLRYRFTDRYNWFQKNELASSVMLFGLLPTGSNADPEEILSVGTTMWDLHTMGDVGIHVGFDKFFKKSLNDRLTLGVEGFYEALLNRELDTPTGEKHPLLITFDPYVGPTYDVDPGDFAGASFEINLVPWKGPARATWLTKGNLEEAGKLPPIMTFTFRYTYVHLGQTDWESDSDIWEWKDREEMWRPGYKNFLHLQVLFSFLRLGVPLQPYVYYRNLTWLPGKNARATNVLAFGLRAPVKFW